MKWKSNDISHIYCNCSNFTDGVCIGMMGPYMSPMPIGASIAMILSLFVALTVTLFRISFITRKETIKTKDAEGLETSQVYKIYNRLERPLLESSMKKSTCG
jgi:multidrug efflux pump subunit AcrB